MTPQPHEFFHYINEAGFFVSVAVGLFLVMEVAYFYGKHRAKKTKEDVSSHVSSFAASILGLMALLLGFTLAMALGRFDSRKALLLAEINDIGSAYLRIDLLAPGDQADMKRMFAEYTQLRVDYYKNGTLAVDMESQLVQTENLQKKIWEKAMDSLRGADRQYSGVNSGQVMNFVSSLVNVFEDETKRVAVRDNHIPEAILWLLIFVAAVAVGINSYALGLKHARVIWPRAVLAIAIAAVLSIMLDLDRPIRGLIQISQKEMIELHAKIAKDVAALPPR